MYSSPFVFVFWVQFPCYLLQDLFSVTQTEVFMCSLFTYGALPARRRSPGAPGAPVPTVPVWRRR